MIWKGEEKEEGMFLLQQRHLDGGVLVSVLHRVPAAS